jgi:hypothetical protein
MPRHLSPEREAVFPDLRRADYEVTSDEDWAYNCIAHAAGRADAPWWPVEEGTAGVFWPEGAPREETMAAFVAAYRGEGYEPCPGPDREEGFEKIALYADAAGTPTHAARQLPSGAWTSKLGDWEDIEHQGLEALAGSTYGRPVQFLRRPQLRAPREEGPAGAASDRAGTA